MRSLIVKIGDLFLANFRWYRRRVGGNWTHVSENVHPAMALWVRSSRAEEPSAYRSILDEEKWPTR